MIEDKLTKAERLRLECFAQVTGRHQMKGTLLLTSQFKEAEEIEAWILKAAAIKL